MRIIETVPLRRNRFHGQLADCTEDKESVLDKKIVGRQLMVADIRFNIKGQVCSFRCTVFCLSVEIVSYSRT